MDELGADFEPLYRTRDLTPDKPLHADLAVVASPSAARALAALELELPVVSIGPETTKAAEEAGVDVLEEASTHDLDGLVDAVIRATR